MCIISNKQENVLEKILNYYVLIIKCPNVFYILKVFDLFTFRDKKKNSKKWVFWKCFLNFSMTPQKHLPECPISQ